MRINLLLIGLLIGAIAGCSNESSRETGQAVRVAEAAGAISSSRSATALPLSTVAFHPDRGELLAYEGNAVPVKRGADKWYPVKLSEEHALRAVATGNLRVNTPEGRPLDIKYKRHVEHKNGNWTWVGEMDGAEPGREAVLTFGEKAVFGSIPYDDAEPLRLAMSGGQTWLVQTDPVLAAMGHGATPTEPDFVIPPNSGTSMGGASKNMASAPPLAYSHASTHPTVDIALGYTNGLAASLGGQSQAITRLTYLVDLTNQAYAASGVNGELRLVRTVMVDYPDATSNRTTLFELTGVDCTSGTGAYLPGGTLNCTSVGQPAALTPLIEARERYGADVVSLVRRFDTAHGSCGIGWMLGGGQQEITAADAAYAMSVISDTSSAGNCRDDTLAHEVGHTLGLQHDRETAQGTDDTDNDGNLLDPHEYGRYPYSFAHSTGADAGNFYTIMALRRAGQTGYLVFSNPNLTSCGGQPCGVPDQADNVRALNQTMAVIAAFRAAVAGSNPQSDINGDGNADILWHNPTRANMAYWLMSGAQITGSAVLGAPAGLTLLGTGDFDGNGRAELLWGGNGAIYSSTFTGTGFVGAFIGSYNTGWIPAAADDINGDGNADVIWHNPTESKLAYWLMSGAEIIGSAMLDAPVGFKLLGTGDLDGNGRAELLWSGNGAIFSSTFTGAGFVGAFIGNYNPGWIPAAADDINGDGNADIIWHNPAEARLVYWLMSGAQIGGSAMLNAPAGFTLVGTADLDGNGRAELVWSGNGAIYSSTFTGTGFVGAVIGTHDSGWLPIVDALAR